MFPKFMLAYNSDEFLLAKIAFSIPFYKLS